MVVKKGDKAKDFVLKDQDGNEVRLSDFKNKKVLLSFHPLAWTGICAKQMQSLEQNEQRFKELNTVALGLSVDSSPSKKAWAASLNIETTRLLADFWPHGEVATVFGLFNEEKGISERANVVIDENMHVVFVKVYPISELPDIDEILKALEDL